MYVPCLRCNLQEVEHEEGFPWEKKIHKEDGSRSAVTDTLSFPLNIISQESTTRFTGKKTEKQATKSDTDCWI